MKAREWKGRLWPFFLFLLCRKVCEPWQKERGKLREMRLYLMASPSNEGKEGFAREFDFTSEGNKRNALHSFPFLLSVLCVSFDIRPSIFCPRSVPFVPSQQQQQKQQRQRRPHGQDQHPRVRHHQPSTSGLLPFNNRAATSTPWPSPPSTATLCRRGVIVLSRRHHPGRPEEGPFNEPDTSRQQRRGRRQPGCQQLCPRPVRVLLFQRKLKASFISRAS